MLKTSTIYRAALHTMPAIILASASWSVNAETYSEYTHEMGGIPMNNYGECWQAVDGITGCGKPMMAMDSDGDGDGVIDDKDQCPNTPKGVKVDARGCALDSDGDGVPDHRDKCPDTPAGAAVDGHGCALDSDGDGVPNYRDKCPGTPAGAMVDSDGCMQKIVLDNVLFQHDKAVLTDAAKTTLDAVANGLSGRPDIDAVVITGHTDSTGTDDYNQRLSQMRADAVKAYLASQGVSADKMQTRGEGESSPVADNMTKAGRAKNRRVEIDVEM